MVRPSSRRRRKRPNRWMGYMLFFLLGSLLSVGGYLYLTHGKKPSREVFSPKVSSRRAQPSSRTPRNGLRPRVAIVIDDLGGENHIFHELLQLNLPLTFSILPFMPHSKAIAEEAHRRGQEVILHLPMEPHDFSKAKPGDGALLLDMDEGNLLRQLVKDIEAIPHIKGVSNHMGSRLMEDPEKMKIVFSELKRRGLFFLDSRTTPQSVGFQTAKLIGLKATERTVFLDNSHDQSDTQKSLEELFGHSLSTGRAIGIGHPYSSTIRSLKEMTPRMKEKGIDIVPVSSLME